MPDDLPNGIEVGRTAQRFTGGLERLMRAAHWGAARADEVAAIADRLIEGDEECWQLEWAAMGGDAWAEATERPSAARYLDAASYYAASLEASEVRDGWVDESALRARCDECWRRAGALLEPSVVALAIPCAGMRVRASLVPAGGGRRPVVVIDDGGRGDAVHAWSHGGAAAHAMGAHWLTFDIPSRTTSPAQHRATLLIDWESVLTPVLDALTALPEVEPSRMAVIGLDHGGYGVPRAMAFEQRLAAAVVAPGVVDVAAPWLELLPVAAREALAVRDRVAFDREMRLGELFTGGTVASARRAARPFSSDDTPLYDAYTRMQLFRLGDELNRVRTPILVCDRPHERLWPGQSRELYRRLSGPKQLVARLPGDDAVSDWLEPAL